MENRKGELTTTQLITIIVLIVSFVVLLYFFFRLNLGATSNSEICHNSVILKSKGGGLAGDLQCKSDYVCISGGEKCSGVNPTISVNVDPNAKTEVLKAIADQMANCWYTFGEGKISYASAKGVGDQVCAVCSVVSFDSKIQSVSYKDLIDYLANTQKSNAQTYLQYLYGRSLEDFLKIPDVAAFYNSETIDAGSQYVIVTGSSKGAAFNLFGGGQVLAVVILKSSQMQQYLGSNCPQFVTKAS